MFTSFNKALVKVIYWFSTYRTHGHPDPYHHDNNYWYISSQLERVKEKKSHVDKQ